MTTLESKESRLRALLREYGSVAVAYSGGVDSSLLASIAHEELGADAHMVLADSPSIPRAEVEDAVRLANERGWDLTVVQTDEIKNEEYLRNDGERCYFCKTALFLHMGRFARENKIRTMAYGAMADDVADYRPGHRAAQEHRVVAPLQEVDLGKDEIRALSRVRGLPTAGKASFACLASRFPTGMRISPENMEQVERAEDALRKRGFHQYRCRHHDDICRIELGRDDFARLLDDELRTAVSDEIRAAGYRFVTLDLAGYRMGSVAAKPAQATQSDTPAT